VAIADSFNEANLVHRFPELLALLRREYALATRIGRMDVYVRRARKDTAAP
jgi:hypothetical protein